MRLYAAIFFFCFLMNACNGPDGNAAGIDSAVKSTGDSVKAVMDSSRIKVNAAIRKAADTLKKKIDSGIHK